VTYHGQYFTINSRISECYHKCETQNAEPEIGTDGSRQTRRNPRVDGYGSGFGPPRVCGSGFWPVHEPNWPVFAVQTRTAGGLPGPVDNTNDACHAVLIRSFNCTTLHSELMHMVKMLKIVYGRSWKLRRRSWIKNGEKVGLYKSKTWSCMNRMWIPGWKHWKLIYIHHSSIGQCVYGLISGWGDFNNWMEMVIYRNDIIAVNNDCMHFAYNWWPFNDCHYVIEVIVNLASMLVSLTLSAFKVLHSHILLRWMYWPPWYVKINVICLLPHPRYEPQWSVDNLWSCILDNH
jgi:hypothetical protein